MPQELFGGAICCELPHSIDGKFQDISAFRHVPDNQEIFMHEPSGACLIVDLLSSPLHVPPSELALFHWNEVAAANGAAHIDGGCSTSTVRSTVLETPRGQLECTRQICRGRQRVSKFNEFEHVNDVEVVLGVLRIPAPYYTDIVVTVSAPQQVAPGSSDARYITEPMPSEVAQQLLETAFDSLTVVDWGLFVEGKE